MSEVVKSTYFDFLVFQSSLILIDCLEHITQGGMCYRLDHIDGCVQDNDRFLIRYGVFR